MSAQGRLTGLDPLVPGTCFLTSREKIMEKTRAGTGYRRYRLISSPSRIDQQKPEHLNMTTSLISRLSARQYMYMYTCRLDSSLLLPCLCFHLSAGEEVGLSGRDSIHTSRNSNSYLAETKVGRKRRVFDDVIQVSHCHRHRHGLGPKGAPPTPCARAHPRSRSGRAFGPGAFSHLRRGQSSCR